MKFCLNCQKEFDEAVNFCYDCGKALIDKKTINDTKQLKCNKCGSALWDGIMFCPMCGEKIPDKQPQQIKCPVCGSDKIPGKKYCGMCGREFDEAPSSENKSFPAFYTLSPKKCPHCGKENDAGTKFCPKCGWNLIGEVNYSSEQSLARTCSVCNANLKPGSRYCEKCGQIVSNEKVESFYCPTCGNKCNPELQYCSKCGNSINKSIKYDSNKNLFVWILVLSCVGIFSRLLFCILSMVIYESNFEMLIPYTVLTTLGATAMTILFCLFRKEGKLIPKIFKIFYIIGVNPIAGALLFKIDSNRAS